MANPHVHSFLHSIRVENIGCIGPDGVEVILDAIVCFVGANNSGKSTVLRAYEVAVSGAELKESDFCTRRNSTPARVELSVHIPEGTPNIDEKWKQREGDLRLVRSRWTWEKPGKPIRQTFDPEGDDWADDGKAAGLDAVFASRLPQPFRIEALDGPVDEHSKLLKLILEPIANELDAQLTLDGSDVSTKREAFLAAARIPVQSFQETIQKAQQRIAESYAKVFNSGLLKLKVDVAPPTIDAMQSLIKGSSLTVAEHDTECEVHQQGTGSQRALFWSMLEVRSALKKELDTQKAIAKERTGLERELQKLAQNPGKQQKKIEENKKRQEELQERLDRLDCAGEHGVSLPGYMLLIDEPEIALHPNAVRAAKAHLYSLASDSGWQVMLSTHSPVFIDPTQDHTTIVRLERSSANPTPKLYRSDDVSLSNDERERLRMLLQFNPSVAELFFGSYPILVEGDTEFAAFLQVVQADPETFPDANRPTVIRAVGKGLLVPLIKILHHFKIPFAVLHDADSPKRSNGSGNGMWTENWKILMAIEACRASGIPVVHRVSLPDFERRFGLQESDRNKPFTLWEILRQDPNARNAASTLLKELASPKSKQSEYDPTCFETELTSAVLDWASENAPSDPRFTQRR